MPQVPKTPILRAAYEAEVKNLSSVVEEMRASGNSPEIIARAVSAMRRALGVKYKNLTPSDLLKIITERNLTKYQDELGPTIEWYLKRGDSWEDIINSSIRPGGKDIKFK